MSTAHIFNPVPASADCMDEALWTHQLGLWKELRGLWALTKPMVYALCGQ